MLRPWRRVIQRIFAVLYLGLIILTIPLAFDVGGEDSGIAFTFTLTAFYVVLSTVRILTRNTKLSIVGSLLYYSQHIIIPSLLILHLGLYSEDHPHWMQIVGPWKAMERNATPVFTLLEGFCTLLVIQAAGQAMRRLNNKSDTWMLVQIISSGCIITTSLYFLYRIYTFPVVLDVTSATLIGAVLTMTTLLGGYGIVSGRGSSIECSLLFAYIVYCLYLTYTDFQSTIDMGSLLAFIFDAPPATSTEQPMFGWLGVTSASPSGPVHPTPSLPPIIVTGYTNMVATIAGLIPQGFVTVYDFFMGALATVTPSVVVSLAFRLSVFYAASRIIPTLQESDRGKKYSKSRALFFVIYAYAPCIIIGVYTHLLMQHFGSLGPIGHQYGSAGSAAESSWSEWILEHTWTNPQLAWKFWGWVNMFNTIALYGLELGQSRGEQLVAMREIKQD
ncbi:hypothetical protein TRVA0_022S00804 [Trichomonascus vanleenenianus]|uniref:Ice2p n=1 Tax=Trichomonascus vanleenenianus TaxID=2268995 RepID=UPI003ECA9CAF